MAKGKTKRQNAPFTSLDALRSESGSAKYDNFEIALDSKTTISFLHPGNLPVGVQRTAQNLMASAQDIMSKSGTELENTPATSAAVEDVMEQTLQLMLSSHDYSVLMSSGVSMNDCILMVTAVAEWWESIAGDPR